MQGIAEKKVMFTWRIINEGAQRMAIKEDFLFRLVRNIY